MKYLIVLALVLFPSSAFAQCTEEEAEKLVQIKHFEEESARLANAVAEVEAKKQDVDVRLTDLKK